MKRIALIVAAASLMAASSASVWLRSDRGVNQRPAGASDGESAEQLARQAAEKAQRERQEGEQLRQAAERERGRVRAVARTRAKEELDWAEKECQRQAEECLRPLAAFFAAAKGRLPAFADECLGWKSKWCLAVDYVPFTSQQRHPAFLNEKFAEQVFKPCDLERVLTQCVGSYRREVQSIENELLVRLRLDVQDLPRECLPELADPATLAALFESAMRLAGAHAGADVERLVEQELVAAIVWKVLTQVAARLGVSGVVLAAGAESSLPTAGASLVIALIIDYLIGKVWDWYADPRGELVGAISSQLDQVYRQVRDGDGVNAGLAGRLRRMASTRSRLRNKAIIEEILKDQQP